jgi:hypothetical protein
MSEQRLIATIRRNAREEIRVTLGARNGAPVFGIRAWFRADDGTMRPSKDGLTLRASLLPELARALADAERQAGSDGVLAASVPSKSRRRRWVGAGATARAAANPAISISPYPTRWREAQPSVCSVDQP